MAVVHRSFFTGLFAWFAGFGDFVTADVRANLHYTYQQGVEQWPRLHICNNSHSLLLLASSDPCCLVSSFHWTQCTRALPPCQLLWQPWQDTRTDSSWGKASTVEGSSFDLFSPRRRPEGEVILTHRVNGCTSWEQRESLWDVHSNSDRPGYWNIY
jgi:hypothetical protein